MQLHVLNFVLYRPILCAIFIAAFGLRSIRSALARKSLNSAPATVTVSSATTVSPTPVVDARSGPVWHRL